jgi:hypothetical protein
MQTTEDPALLASVNLVTVCSREARPAGKGRSSLLGDLCVSAWHRLLRARRHLTKSYLWPVSTSFLKENMLTFLPFLLFKRQYFENVGLPR